MTPLCELDPGDLAFGTGEELVRDATLRTRVCMSPSCRCLLYFDWRR
jgi:hypothetical protein